LYLADLNSELAFGLHQRGVRIPEPATVPACGPWDGIQ
jgi:hypothetical protein